MRQIAVFIEGPPISKKRPRVVFRNTKPHTYTPEDTANYEAMVGMLALQQMREVDFEMVEKGVPVELEIEFTLKSPQASRPDLNNLIASIQDGLNGVWYWDDSQVVSLRASKIKGDKLGAFVRLTVLEDQLCLNVPLQRKERMPISLSITNLAQIEV